MLPCTPSAFARLRPAQAQVRADARAIHHALAGHLRHAASHHAARLIELGCKALPPGAPGSIAALLRPAALAAITAAGAAAGSAPSPTLFALGVAPLPGFAGAALSGGGSPGGKGGGTPPGGETAPSPVVLAQAGGPSQYPAEPVFLAPLDPPPALAFPRQYELPPASLGILPAAPGGTAPTITTLSIAVPAPGGPAFLALGAIALLALRRARPT